LIFPLSDRVKAHLAIIVANILFGINYSAAKHVMPGYIMPDGFTLLRIVSAAALFWLTSIFFKREKVARVDYLRLFMASVFGVVLNQLLFLKGLNYTTPIDSSIIMTVNPVLVLVISALILRDAITSTKLMGIAVGASGAILLIVQSGDVSFAGEHFAGNVMTFFNALFYAFYLVLIKPLMMRYSPITVMRWVFTFGLIMILPVGFTSLSSVHWAVMPGMAWGAIVFVLVGPTYLAYLLNSKGLQYLKPATVSIYIYSQPIIASLVSVWLGQDSITFVKVISTLLVFIGVYLVSGSGDVVKRSFRLLVDRTR
jgi:Predicted permeases